MSGVLEQAAAVRRGVGLFQLPDRGVIEVTGGDRVVWLNGMVTNDVAALDAAGPRSGCHALLLTRQGRIVADLHVLALRDRLLLETRRSYVAKALEHLEKYVIADDVVLEDSSAAWARLALEGPEAAGVLATACGGTIDLEPDDHTEVDLGGLAVRVARFGFSGEPAFQLFADAAASASVRQALREAARGAPLVEGSREALCVLRIEAGIPELGRELDESVLPSEARLEASISQSKGCYVGQEVVARMHSRGRANHLLVGLRFEGDAAPEAGAGLEDGDTRVGELTSSAISPRFGPVGLGFVRHTHAAPGTELRAAGKSARVAGLPFWEVPSPDGDS